MWLAKLMFEDIVSLDTKITNICIKNFNLVIPNSQRFIHFIFKKQYE